MTIDLGLAVPSIGEAFIDALWRGGRAGVDRHDPKAVAEHLGVLTEERALVAFSTQPAWIASEDPVQPRVVRRRVLLGDLIPRVGTSASQVPYVRELGPTDLDLGASGVPEAGEKPEAEIRFEGDTAHVAKAAALAFATSDILDDAVGLRAYIDGRLMYLVGVREEQQILNGDGTNETALGITEQPAVQSQAFATSITETVARALEKVELVDGSPDAVVIHPSAYRAARLAAPTWWSGLDDVRVIRTRAVGADKALVGSFAEGAMIRDRSTKVRFSDTHDDFFVKNKIAIVGERRFALCVTVPYYFVDVTLA